MGNIAHRISDYIIKVCGPNIAMEDIQIKNMIRNRGLARAISESLWGRIRWMLEYKCRRRGGQLVLVDPRNTSKTCNACKTLKADLLRSHRVFECNECGTKVHRDLNASWNIGCRGMDILNPELGVESQCAEGKPFGQAGGCALFAGLADVDNSGVKDFIDFESMALIQLQETGKIRLAHSAHGG